jgi:hypothetical protein
MQSILDNWETTCRRDLRIALEPLPWIIFYDESQAWHLKPEKALLPPHETSSASLTFARGRHRLIRVAHKGILWVPGREALPVKPAQPDAVTMLYANEQKPFFIVPLPVLFHKLAAADQAPNLDKLFIGLAIHELAHTRQLVYAAAQLKRLRTRYKLPKSLNDNMIEQEFGANEAYKRLYEEEQKHLSSAILASNLWDCHRAVEQALLVAEKRKGQFFVGDRQGYSELEDIFLALEGLAMWVQYQTARRHAPKSEEWLTTLIELSKRTDSWSQAEGMGLFLLLDRFVPGWQARFLAPDFPSPFTVLREALGKRHLPKLPAKTHR